MEPTKQKPTIPTDPEERKEYFREMGSQGGKTTSASPKAIRPFRDIPGLAKKAGSTKGYTFKRKSTQNEAA